MSHASPSGQSLRTKSTDNRWRRREMAEWEKQIFAINLIVGDLE